MQSQIDLINEHNASQDRRMDNFNIRQTNQDARLNGLEADVDRVLNNTVTRAEIDDILKRLAALEG